MKTTEQTILPNNKHEHKQPIYELKLSRWFKIGAYFVAFIMLLMGFFLGLVGLMFSSSSIIFLMSVGDIYIYEGYVERRCLLPFMNPYIIDYDEMHVHIYVDHFKLSRDRTPPKRFKFPYEWLKANPYVYIRVASSSRYYTPEILEFLKTKAQSVNDHT